MTQRKGAPQAPPWSDVRFLEEIEWAGRIKRVEYGCPCCGQSEWGTHAPDCELKRRLDLARKQEACPHPESAVYADDWFCCARCDHAWPA